MTYSESSFEFTDPDRTEQHLAEAYGTARVTQELRLFRQRLAGDANIQLHEGTFEGSFEVAVEIDQFVFATAPSPCTWEEGREGGDMSLEPVLFRPGTPYVNRFTHTENWAVIFDPATLQRTARLLYGRPDLRLEFDGPRPATAATGRIWFTAVECARADWKSGLLRYDLLRAAAFRMLSVSALECFRVRGDRQALHLSALRQRAIVAAAADFFHDYASLPITVDDAADAAGVSTRELIAAFQGSTQLSPTVYLRDVRLQAAHQDLVAGDPAAGDTVTAIAHRWGFRSPSRFAARYRATYGVNPRWVLDR